MMIDFQNMKQSTGSDLLINQHVAVKSLRQKKGNMDMDKRKEDERRREE